MPKRDLRWLNVRACVTTDADNPQHKHFLLKVVWGGTYYISELHIPKDDLLDKPELYKFVWTELVARIDHGLAMDDFDVALSVFDLDPKELYL